MKLNEIHMRDPYILLEDDQYYLYGSRGSEVWGLGTGLDVFVSEDMKEWEGPIEVFKKPDNFWADRHFWAPEVHKFKDKFYMFVSFKSENQCRGTQILIADTPIGPFQIHSDGPVTPRDWECLDGTLYVDYKGTPYMIFCHEWVQVMDGEMCAIELSSDLKKAVSEPILLFTASKPAWALKGVTQFVTDGPFVYRSKEGRLMIIWSSGAKEGYCAAITYSDNGEITGNWIHQEKLLFSKDGGHGMVVQDKSRNLFFVLHSPNQTPFERPRMIPLLEVNNTLVCMNEGEE